MVFLTGAGAEMRHAMGVAVFVGMICVTLFCRNAKRSGNSGFSAWPFSPVQTG